MELPLGPALFWLVQLEPQESQFFRVADILPPP